MDECERLEEIQLLIDELTTRALNGSVILVEGRRDREALDALGVRGEIIMTSQRTLLNLCEELARTGSDVIILSDWDERGDEVAGLLHTYLEADGLRPDLAIRDRVKTLARKEIKDVENLHRYVGRLREMCSAKPQPY
ncbi:DNA primase [Methanocella sp. MCL-LM]|uniref:DNA primase n=1 Tax=Methanocella sp. MCL-LM TaxID=3412035 RepID=UPI003C73D5F0